MIRQSGLIFLSRQLCRLAAPCRSRRPPRRRRSSRAAGNTIGTVVDISGAVIPGADVAVTSRDGRTQHA